MQANNNVGKSVNLFENDLEHIAGSITIFPDLAVYFFSFSFSACFLIYLAGYAGLFGLGIIFMIFLSILGLGHLIEIFEMKHMHAMDKRISIAY